MLQIIPAVDVLDGKVVRLMHGDYDRVTVYAHDPVAQSEKWAEQGAPLVHVVDLEGARTGAPDVDLWRRLSDVGVKFQVGGGIRTAALAERAIQAGAERVVLGTAAVWKPEILSAVSEPDRVVAAVDVRDNQATGQGWLGRGRDIREVFDGLAEAGVQRILVTGIERDGTMEGPNTELLKVATEGNRFQVIASGGVGSLDDLTTVQEIGCEAVIVGRALYEGVFDVRDAIGFVKGTQPVE